jgi:predicted O-linked N-acetylglucosamine transferase (SPINDLY family)
MELRRAVEIRPECAEAARVLHLLGITLATLGRFSEAIIELRRAVELRPDYFEAFYNLAHALQDDNQLAIAADTYRRAIALRSTSAPAHNNLGITLQLSQDFASAEAAFREAIRLQPKFPEAHYNLGNVLKEQNRLDDAITSYRQALALNPNYSDALVNLGNLLQRRGDLDNAIALFRRALALNPNHALAHNSLGNALKDAGDLDGAIDSYRRSIAAGGENWAWDNLLYTIHFHPAYDPAQIAREHDDWNGIIAQPLTTSHLPHLNPRSPARPLNIAYVSPDFRQHPVGRFLLPLLSRHDHENYRIFCYSDVRFPDDLTRSLQSHADVWRDTELLSDDELATQIRQDQIDILIDLTMHMDGNRLLAFARRPAPVQVTYLAYCSTTGLSSMHYRLSDPHLDPLGIDETIYSERTVRLPRTYWCYQPPASAPPVQPPPAHSTGHITFGCLNNYSKVTDLTWDLWIRILQAVPDSRLLIQSPRGSHRDLPRQRLYSAGLDPARLTFADRVLFVDYLALYNQIDIALDPFSYGGGTTTCDALYMGLPVVTLTGATAVSRGGSSILHNLGHPQWIATDPDGYVNIVRDLASDPGTLLNLRQNLRQTMLASPLTDAPAFARDFESTLRQMWKEWCGQ